MKQRRRRKPKYEKLQFEGNFYNYKENDPGVSQTFLVILSLCVITFPNVCLIFQVIRLSEPYNVFVSQAKLTTAKNLTCTAQAFTRRLCTLVFTQDALDHCSPTGRPATGNGRENATLRPPLDGDGVQAIVGESHGPTGFFFRSPFSPLLPSSAPSPLFFSHPHSFTEYL